MQCGTSLFVLKIDIMPRIMPRLILIACTELNRIEIVSQQTFDISKYHIVVQLIDLISNIVS